MPSVPAYSSFIKNSCSNRLQLAWLGRWRSAIGITICPAALPAWLCRVALDAARCRKPSERR